MNFFRKMSNFKKRSKEIKKRGKTLDTYISSQLTNPSINQSKEHDLQREKTKGKKTFACHICEKKV